MAAGDRRLMTKSMKYKIHVFIIILIISMPSMLIGKYNLKNQSNIDLSTPEKALGVFIEAFKTGDNSLLDFVLAENASIPEFNALQVIKCPSPEIICHNHYQTIAS